jgi:hypothetical protein
MGKPGRPIIQVEKVDVPQPSRIAGALTPVDYADAYRVALPADFPPGVVAFARRLFDSRPAWVDGLMSTRDLAVAFLGLKTAPRSAAGVATFEPGSKLGLFRVFERTEREILLGQDDKHLDFRLSLLLDGSGHAIVTTVVKFNRLLGRAYFAPVRPLHRLIVPAMMRAAVRPKDEAARGA